MLAQASNPDVTSPAFWSTPMPWIVIAIVIVVVAALLAFAARRQRSRHLKDRFGPEYDSVVTHSSSRDSAEEELAAREKRHRSFDIRPITPGARERYAEEWRAVQARFVEVPGDAIREADRLVTSAMRDRGYPMEDFEQSAADLSVEHGEVVQDYRVAHQISLKNDRGNATTEDLRQAMIAYRSLFESLLQSNVSART